MPSLMPAPQFKGFTILRFDLKTGLSDQQKALYGAPYQMGPFSLSYDAANWVYRFCLKVEYPPGTPVPGTFPPSVFAIIYAGTARQDDTYVMPLVSAGIGPKNTLPVPSQYCDSHMMEIRQHYMIELQMQNPDPNLKNFYYGFLELDYHYSDMTYQPGPHTIELMLGWGNVKAQPNNWTTVQTCEWDM